VERELLETDTTLLETERSRLLKDLAAKEERLRREKEEQVPSSCIFRPKSFGLVNPPPKAELIYSFYLLITHLGTNVLDFMTLKSYKVCHF
jgi:hypothetical protein